MSPYLNSLLSLVSADLATTSPDVKSLRAEVLVDELHAADIALARDEADGIPPADIVTRFVAARGDHGKQHWLRGLAAEFDAANRFGPRLVDELDALAGDYATAA